MRYIQLRQFGKADHKISIPIEGIRSYFKSDKGGVLITLADYTTLRVLGDVQEVQDKIAKARR